MIREPFTRPCVAIFFAVLFLAAGICQPLPAAAHGDDLVVETIPVGDPLRPWFRKRVMIFGIEVVATSGVSDVKILHAAAVMAEYLDPDEDSVADQAAVVLAMQQRRADAAAAAAAAAATGAANRTERASMRDKKT